MDLKKDNYFFKFMISSCRFEIRINDIPLLSYPGPGSVATQLYINQYLNTGRNTFSVTMLPVTDDGFVPTSHCMLQAIHTINGKETILAEAQWRWDSEQPLPIWSITQPFMVTTPLVASPWMELPEKKELSNEDRSHINHTYRLILDAFRKGNIQAISQLSSPRDNFFAARYHLNPDARKEEIKAALQTMISSCTFEDSPMSAWAFKTYAGNRLFTFELPDTRSPVRFKKTGTDQMGTVPVILSIDKNNAVNWIL